MSVENMLDEAYECGINNMSDNDCFNLLLDKYGEMLYKNEDDVASSYYIGKMQFEEGNEL